MQININELTANKYSLEGDMSAVRENTRANGADTIFSSDIFGIHKEINGDNTYGRELEEGNTEKDDRLELLNKALTSLKDNMTPEAYNKLEELGLAPKDMDPAKAVTIDERIQIELAAYCQDYEGTGMPIDSVKAKEVLGNNGVSVASAINMAKDIMAAGEVDENTGRKQLPDNAKAYLLKNGLEPTIKNTYLAIHSGIYEEGHISEEAFSQMKPQLENVYKNAGVEFDENAMAAARFMLDNQIPVNEDTIKLMENIQSLELDMSEAQLTQLVAEGSKNQVGPENIVMAANKDYIGKAQEAVDTLNNVTNDDLNYVITNNNKLTLQVLREAKAERQQEKLYNNENTNEVYIRAQVVVAQARATMTVASFVQIQRLGVNIDTTELWQIVEQLQRAEDDYARASLMSIEGNGAVANIEMGNGAITQLDAYETTMAVARSFTANYSVHAISYTASVYSSISMAADSNSSISAAGRINQLTLMSMEATYSGVGTEVRRDLGDSINKAFGNIEELLQELGIEVNERNIKTAKILGYNSMAITEEHIEQVGELSSQLDRLLGNLKPQTVLELVKQGINPLSTDIRELNDMLEQQGDSQYQQPEEEGYSKFLWKMEKKGQVTKEERQTYIAMYRLINTISKNEGNYVGALYEQGRQVNLRNLLSVARTRKIGGIDISLDKSFGLLEGIDKPDDILRDIDSYMASNDHQASNPNRDLSYDYSSTQAEEEAYLAEANNHINPEGVAHILSIEQPGNTTPEDLANIMKNNDKGYEYEAQQLKDVGRAAAMAENVAEALMSSDITPTTNNILWAGMLMGNEKNIFANMRQAISGRGKSTAAGSGEGGSTSANTGLGQASSLTADTGIGQGSQADISSIQEEEGQIMSLLSGQLPDQEEALQQTYDKLEDILSRRLQGERLMELTDYEELQGLRDLKGIASIMQQQSRQRTYTIESTINNQSTIIKVSIGQGQNNKVNITWDSENFGHMKAELMLKEDMVGGSITVEYIENSSFANERAQNLAQHLANEGLKLAQVSIKAVSLEETRLLGNIWEHQAVGTREQTPADNNRTLYRVAKLTIEAFV